MLQKDEVEIRQAINSEKNLPISEYYDLLSLKHETIAGWFFQVDDKNKRNGINYFERFISNISSEYEIQLFTQIINNRDFKCSFLNVSLSESKQIEILEKLSLSDENINILIQLGRIFRKINKEKAENYLLRASQLTKDSYYLNFELGKLFQKENQEKAIGYFNNALLLARNNYQISYVNVEIGKCMFYLSMFTESLQYFEEALKLFKGNVFALIFLAKAKWEIGDKNKAKDLLRRIIKGNKEKEYAYRELSKMLFKDGQHKQNIQILDELLQIENYKNELTINSYIHSHFKQFDYSTIITFLDKIFKLNPDIEKNFKFLNYYASCCEKIKDNKRALIYYEKSLYFNPKQNRTQYFFELLNLKCSIEEKNFPVALISCDKILNSEVSDYILNIKGNILKELKDYKGSEKYYNKALKLTEDPKYRAQYLNNIALLILESRQINRCEEAINLCKDALDICPNFRWSEKTLERLRLLT